MRDGVASNVRIHLEQRPVPLGYDAWLLPSPLKARAVASDPTDWMDAASTPEGVLRIGLAHGSVQGFGSERSASVAIAPDRSRRAGLDYLALGDWHGAQQIGPSCWYAGTPEPDSFLSNDQGQALIVAIDGPHAVPRVQRREIGTYRWLERRVDAGRRTDLATLEGEVEGLGARARHTLLSVTVGGHVSFEQDREIRARLKKLNDRVFHLELRLDSMVLDVGDGDVSCLRSAGLRELGQELSEAARDPAHPEHEVAARALRHLLEMCARIGDGAGRPA